MSDYTPHMQTPMLVFNHIAKTATAVPTGPAEKRLAELARGDRNIATSGRPSK